MKHQDWRPDSLSDYIGQKPLIRLLQTEIECSRRSPARAIRHAIFSGPGGLGKDTLCQVLAKERGLPKPVMLFGKGLTQEDLTNALGHLESPGYSASGSLGVGGGQLLEPDKAVFPIVIINEADALDRGILQLLHPVLEPDADGRRIFQGKITDGNQVQVGPIWIVGCTIIFLTNFLGNILQKSPATLSRFPIQWQFEYYEEEEIAQVITQYGQQNDLEFDDDAALHLASRAYGVPRQAITLVQWVPNAMKPNETYVSLADVKATLKLLSYDELGWSRPMINYLKALERAGGTLGIQSLAGVMAADAKTLEVSVEPALLRNCLIEKCSSGRVITRAGRAALGNNCKKNMLLQRTT